MASVLLLLPQNLSFPLGTTLSLLSVFVVWTGLNPTPLMRQGQVGTYQSSRTLWGKGAEGALEGRVRAGVVPFIAVLNLFSCAPWPFADLLWRNVYFALLLVFILCYFFIEL